MSHEEDNPNYDILDKHLHRTGIYHNIGYPIHRQSTRDSEENSDMLIHASSSTSMSLSSPSPSHNYTFPAKQFAVLVITVLPEILIYHMLGHLFPMLASQLLGSEDKVKIGSGLLQVFVSICLIYSNCLFK